MADLFVQTAKLIHRQLQDVQFLVPLLSRETRRQFEEALYRNNGEDLPLTILFGHAHMAMTASDGVLVASGTAALEAALLKRPMVVTYKMPWLTYVIGRKVVLPYVSLPNVLARPSSCRRSFRTRRRRRCWLRRWSIRWATNKCDAAGACVPELSTIASEHR